MEWKSRRREVPERLEPSLSSGALAEEEGLDRFLSDYCDKRKSSLVPITCFSGVFTFNGVKNAIMLIIGT